MCEYHLFRFMGKTHVAYLPTGHLLGLSKVTRIVEVFARQMQIQENLMRQIAETIQEVIHSDGVGGVIEASHMCIMMRGVGKQNSIMKYS